MINRQRFAPNSQCQKGFRWFRGKGAIALVNIQIYAVAATVNCQVFIAPTQLIISTGIKSFNTLQSIVSGNCKAIAPNTEVKINQVLEMTFTVLCLKNQEYQGFVKNIYRC
ncbi:MAG: hypothetical protein RMZ43_017630 [Nostoc sp. CmiVER01]|uniref:hypothetical protein n=1 Tax=Nostoc sp. CmiVER01 TaxID=3075384 RepID=UPI002AD488EB|nr:hypothetical protein [Nostoc sp. CmiVER01]MDZ8124346.1 hypothetical protein [Nostoc sp. CmiVER01]